jgi:hypothetical protein
LQADNCTGEAKNRYVIAFLAYLVQRGWFLECQLSFMLQYHTHEDIDQNFSTCSQYVSIAVIPAALIRIFSTSCRGLHYKNIHTLSQWLRAYRSSWQDEDKRPALNMVPWVANFKVPETNVHTCAGTFLIW